MSIQKQKVDNILIFKLPDYYTTEDFTYFWEIAIKETAETEEIFSAAYILVDCSKLKGIEQTGGELFLLQQKFEGRKKGNFFYCGLDSEQEKLFLELAYHSTGKKLTIRNFKTCEEALRYIKSQSQ